MTTPGEVEQKDSQDLDDLDKEIAELELKLKLKQSELQQLQPTNGTHHAEEDETKSASRRPRVLLALVLLCIPVGLAWLIQQVQQEWRDFLEADFSDSFFRNRPEYIYLTSMSTWTKRLVVRLPFIDSETRAIIEKDPWGHISNGEDFDPSLHNRDFRRFKRDFLTKEECETLRAVSDRNSMGGASASAKFQRWTLLQLLGVYTGSDGPANITREEQQLLSNVLERIQEQVEDMSGRSTVAFEHGEMTRERNPVQAHTPAGKWGFVDWMRRLHQKSTGGFALRADQCEVYTELKHWHHKSRCQPKPEYCCTMRAFSAHLYLNDMETGKEEEGDDDKLVGGDLYLVNRKGRRNDTKPSYSGANLAKILRNTIRVKPQCGNLILFASDARNYHGMFAIEKGTHHAISLWFTDLKNLAWKFRHSLEHELPSFWKTVDVACLSMGAKVGLPIPSELKESIGNCDEIIETLQTWADSSATEYEQEVGQGR